MRLSERYQLGVTQAALDFVDVDPTRDVPVYIDPAAIRLQAGEWSEGCQSQLRTYFAELLEGVRKSDVHRLRELVAPLVGSQGEPNETHLGVSSGRSRGRGLAQSQADALIAGLAASRAATSGLLRDLEDSVLFIPGLGPDILSDMTTCVIRISLVEYTQKMCSFYEIPTEVQETGPWWDADALEWRFSTAALPRAENDKLLLVPKSIVRVNLITDAGEFYRGYLRPLLIAEEMASTSGLVRILKDGTREPKLGAIKAKYGSDKRAVASSTAERPQVMAKYRASITTEEHPPLDQVRFVELGAPPVDFDELFDAVAAIRPGRGGATLYHRAIAALLSALWDSSLGNQVLEQPIHEGRKRLDIRYDNVAGDGFFRWLSLNYPTATVPVECKNYGRDIANPELDQIAMRLSRLRGIVGLVVSRTFDDKNLFLRRCHDAARDDKGLVLALDDDDLLDMIEYAKDRRSAGQPWNDFPLLRERFDYLIN